MASKSRETGPYVTRNKGVEYFLDGCSEVDPDGIHMANCHIPGVYSISLKKKDDGSLIRLYFFDVNKEYVDPSIVDGKGPLLIHRHNYNFLSTTLCGLVINKRYEDIITNRTKLLYAYDFKPLDFKETGIDRIFSGRPKVEYIGHRMMRSLESSVGVNSQYDMHATEYHSVQFIPGSTGRFAALIEESPARKRDLQPKPQIVLCERFIQDVPNKDKLYQVIPNSIANKVLESAKESTRIAVEEEG